MKDPVRVTVGSDELTANSRVDQVVEVVDHNKTLTPIELSKVKEYVNLCQSRWELMDYQTEIACLPAQE